MTRNAKKQIVAEMATAKRAATWLWRITNAVSTGQWVWSVIGGGIVAALSLLLGLPLPIQIALGVLVFGGGVVTISTLLERRSGTLQKISAASEVEGELVLAREEAAYAKELIAHTDPVTAAMVKAAWPDWRARMAAYVSLAVSRGAGAGFNPVGREETVMALGEPVGVNLDIGADIKLLDGILSDLRPDPVGADQGALEETTKARRENGAASLFQYSDATQ